jgi:chromosome segregation ATPase
MMLSWFFKLVDGVPIISPILVVILICSFGAHSETDKHLLSAQQKLLQAEKDLQHTKQQLEATENDLKNTKHKLSFQTKRVASKNDELMDMQLHITYKANELQCMTHEITDLRMHLRDANAHAQAMQDEHDAETTGLEEKLGNLTSQLQDTQAALQTMTQTMHKRISDNFHTLNALHAQHDASVATLRQEHAAEIARMGQEHAAQVEGYKHKIENLVRAKSMKYQEEQEGKDRLILAYSLLVEKLDAVIATNDAEKEEVIESWRRNNAGTIHALQTQINELEERHLGRIGEVKTENAELLEKVQEMQGLYQQKQAQCLVLREEIDHVRGEKAELEVEDEGLAGHLRDLAWRVEDGDVDSENSEDEVDKSEDSDDHLDNLPDPENLTIPRDPNQPFTPWELSDEALEYYTTGTFRAPIPAPAPAADEYTASPNAWDFSAYSSPFSLGEYELEWEQEHNWLVDSGHIFPGEFDLGDSVPAKTWAGEWIPSCDAPAEFLDAESEDSEEGESEVDSCRSPDFDEWEGEGDIEIVEKEAVEEQMAWAEGAEMWVELKSESGW